MEISTEINKIFGQEMAKLFAEQISEDLRREAVNSYLDRFKDEVNKYLESEEAKIDIQTEARKLVDEIRETARKKIIEKASNALVSVYSGNEVSDAIAEMSYTLRRN